MKRVPLAELSGLELITPKCFEDERGFFSETYNKETLARLGIGHEFVQDNHSLSRAKGTVRGLHFQRPPFAQAKLVRVVRGSILDVAVDLRCGSPTYGRHTSLELSAANWQQLYVPVGFGHGFCTLETGTEVIYKVSAFYSAAHDGGILWNDPDLGVAWPVSPEAALLSPKDRALPRLADLKTPF